MSFGAAQNITGDSNVNNTFGVLDRAFNFGLSGVSDATINGVTFLAGGTGFNQNSTTFGTDETTTVLTALNGSSNSNNGAFASSNAPYANLSPDMQTMLSSAIFYDSAGETLELSLNGLTIGASYLIQLFVNDSRSFAGSRTDSIFTPDAQQNNVILKYNATSTDGGIGQFVTATFTADATTQAFDILGNVSAQINGFQLRVIAPIPEPGTVGLLFSGCSIMLLVARNRRQSSGPIVL